MSKRQFFTPSELPKEVVVIEGEEERKIYLLKCSRRKLGELLEMVMNTRNA